MNIPMRIVSVLLVITMLGALSACSSSEPCKSCGTRGTKGYKNDSSGKTIYYCSDCSSKCFFCGERAKHHYTTLLGTINFVCDDCYDGLHRQ